MTEKSTALVSAADVRTAFITNRDARERQAGDSPLGISHQDRCEHNVSAATCLLCIYGEAGNKVVIDAAAFDYAADVHEQAQFGEAPAPEVIAEQAFRAGAAMGMGTQRESDVANAVIGTRAGAVDPKSLVHTLLAYEAGTISKEDALRATMAWQENVALEMRKENAGPTARALTGGNDG